MRNALLVDIHYLTHFSLLYVPLPDTFLVHLNDSKKACGTCVDRHAHLGEGFMFKSSMDALVQLFAMYASVPFVLETHDKKPYPIYSTEIART